MSEELAIVILGIVGAILQLVFKYAPKVSEWYQAQENKGALMLAFVVLVSIGYFALGCSAYGAQLGIVLACDQQGLIELGKAIFFIASGQSMTYLYTRK